MAAKVPPPPPAPPEPVATTASPRHGLMILTWCAIGVALLATVAVVWLLVLNGPRAEAVPQNRAPVHVFRAGTIVVNVAESSGRRYLRTTLELGTSAKDGRRLEDLRAPILDAAIGILGGTPLDTLLDHTKREGLKEELKNRINERIGAGGVSQVFFTEFVIQ